MSARTTSTSPRSSSDWRPAERLTLGPAEVRFTGRGEGDFGPAAGTGEPGSVLDRRQRALVDRWWKTVHQVHGTAVVVADRSSPTASHPADALVSADPTVALAVKVADCAPVMLASPEGVIAAVHAGWRGLVAGVVERAAEEMRALGATAITAAAGPSIGPECYEFSAGDLERVAARLGDEVRGLTAGGRPALDLRAAVRAALVGAGAELAYQSLVCTACSQDYFSHRARAEVERQAAVIWVP